VIEAVFSQLAKRFRLKRTWVRDFRHLSHRVIQKVLSHTLSVWLNVTAGRRPLGFEGFDGFVANSTRTPQD
jgi:hypothetical protein